MFKFVYKDWTKVHQSIWERILNKHGLLQDKEKIVIEVGCFEGRSTVWFSERLIKTPTSRYFCIDSWSGGEEIDRLKLDYDMKLVYENFKHNIDLLKCKDQISIFRSNSEEALSNLLTVFYRKADFIYLDGSHTKRDTLVDLILALTLLKKDGILIVDDYRNNMGTEDMNLRPTEAVDFVLNTMKKELAYKDTSEGQMVIKRIS